MLVAYPITTLPTSPMNTFAIGKLSGNIAVTIGRSAIAIPVLM
tara:strand:+ start:6683 stop:6811 length:129 start_codon:yes stop_codon:yes gene_type:complete